MTAEELRTRHQGSSGGSNHQRQDFDFDPEMQRRGKEKRTLAQSTEERFKSQRTACLADEAEHLWTLSPGSHMIQGIKTARP